MTEIWLGVYKLQEEMGEVGQLLGKLGPFPVGDHPDGKGPIAERLPLEIGDLYAALDYFVERNLKDSAAVITKQRKGKLDKFRHWGLTGIAVQSIAKTEDQFLEIPAFLRRGDD